MGSIAWDIIMSFLWIALSLSSLLPTPSLSSISPILRHIDNNNQDGPHFRSFLFPSSLRHVNTHKVQTIPTSELQKTSHSSLSVPEISHSSLVVPEISHPNLSEISSPTLSVPEISHSTLSVPKVSQPILSAPEIPHQSSNVPEIPHSQSLDNLEILENNLEKLENSLEILENSLQTFTVELHPEEELVRSG